MQKGPQGYIFFSLKKPKLLKICKFQMEGSIPSIPLHLLWFGTSLKDINSHLMRILIFLLIKPYVQLIRKN